MWNRFPVCLELLSPLHIGFLPNTVGTVSAPTRLYVPGKNVWAAVTAALAERMFDSPGPQDFAVVGADLRNAAVFSYFYLCDGERVFTPSYSTGELRWGELQDCDFRAIFLHSRISTQIAGTGTAEDGSLHEIEFIRQRIGSPITGARPSLLCGVIWLQEQSTLAGVPLEIEHELPVLSRGKSKLPLLEEIVLGGERNYGFGRVHRLRTSQTIARQLEDLWPADYPASFLLNGPLAAHSAYMREISFKGEIEIVASREYPKRVAKVYESPGASISSSGYFFAPGTVIGEHPITATIDSFGRINLNLSNSQPDQVTWEY
jgi:hypothetical protein